MPHRCVQSYFLFPKTGLGDGWAPAVIYSETEFRYIHASIAWRKWTRSFWVGGSTSGAGIRANIAFYEYQTNSTGKDKEKSAHFILRIFS